MLRYLLRRILLAIPTLLVVSMLVFVLNKCAPGDPVTQIYGVNFLSSADPEAQSAVYQLNAAKLGLDKPVFYCALSTAVFPDTMYKIFPPQRRSRLETLATQAGDWPAVSRYEQALAAAVRALEKIPDSLPQKTFIWSEMSDLLIAEQLPLADSAVARSQRAFGANQGDSLPGGPNLGYALQRLQRCIDDMYQAKAAGKYRHWIPAFHWYGFDNQYHNWAAGFFTGELGMSTFSKNPVWQEIRPRLNATLFINGVAMLLAYLLAVPLGVAMSRRKDKIFDRWVRRLLMVLFAIPVFWMGGMLMLLFATPGHGLHLINGIAIDPWQGSGRSFASWVLTYAPKFILPVAVLTLHALALLALQMRSGMLGVLQEDYIRTARAKGLDENAVYWRHAFRNALFPIITIFASVFPAVFGGSLVVEYLFHFPGMGMKTHEAFLSRDYPVLFAILMFSAVLTVLGALVADLLYAWADPRVRFSKR